MDAVSSKKGCFPRKDLRGKRTGMLVGLEPTGIVSKQDKSVIWLFQCDCGRKVKYAASRFKRVYSCGCSQRPNSGRYSFFDWTGETINHCTVLSPTDRRDTGGYVVWSIRCDLCGETFDRPASALARHSVRHGCSEWWDNYGRFRKIGRKPIPNGGSYINLIFGGYKKAARERGFPFNLSKEEAVSMFLRNCHYCGAAPRKITRKNLHGEFAYNGIDRMDSGKGYEASNCVPCCDTCNFAKRNMTIDEFREWARRLYGHLVGGT